MTASEEQLRKILDCIYVSHREDALDCDTCDNQIACLAEKVVNGANLHELWPEFEAHLNCCRDCFEEFEALMCILRADDSGQIALSSTRE